MYTGVRGLLRIVCSWNLEQFTAVRVHGLPIASIEPSTCHILWRSIILLVLVSTPNVPTAFAETKER